MTMRHLVFFNLICKEQMSYFLGFLGRLDERLLTMPVFMVFYRHFTLQNTDIAAVSVKPEPGC